MSRFRITTALSLLPLGLVACGGDDGGTATAGMPEFCRTALARVDSFMATQPETELDPARYGGTVVVGGIGEIADGMNGLISASYEASQHQSFVNMMNLIRYDEDLRPVPYLAESWEVDDPDHPTELTWHLRDDVYWHDGERTDAYDVAFTYLTITDPETAFPNAAFWDYYVKGPEGVEVVDSLTVRIRLRPHAEYLDAWRTTTIMPEHLLGDVPRGEVRQHPYGTRCPVGNGPFVFVEHRPQESWTFRANPAFPEGLGGRPYLDRYVYRVIPEQTTLLTELLTGNVDVYIAPPADQAQRIMDDPAVEFDHFLLRNYTFVGWNSRRPQLADARVRRALTVGTNRAEIVDALLQGYGVVANSGVPPFHWAFDETLVDSLGYDPDQARRLLDEAGWTDRDGDGIRENGDGLPLRISVKYNQGNRDRQNIAEIMQAQLRQVGVDLQPQVVEFSTLISQINDPVARDFDGVIMGWVTEFKVDDIDLFHSERVDAPYAWSGTMNPRLDRLLDTLQLVVDREEALPLWREYQSLIIEEMPYTYFFFPERLSGISKRMRDVQMDVRGEWINIKDWWVPQDQRRGAARAAGS
ncbi:MAG: hypothetical protein KY453_04620 [Gemmatimonadetes bacterium]|nr:hypothetical protein [Gemmatimonadota bacterium]